MPIFEFECLKCGKEFEEIVSRDYTGIQCPGCESKEVKKLLSLFGFRSKGSDGSTSKSSSSSCSSCCPGCDATRKSGSGDDENPGVTCRVHPQPLGRRSSWYGGKSQRGSRSISLWTLESNLAP